MYLDTAHAQFFQSILDEMAINDLVVALVIVAQQIIVAGRPLIACVVIATQGDRLVNDFLEDLHIIDELGQDPKAAFSRLVKENVGHLGIPHGDHPDLVGLDLEHALNGALQRMLQGDDALGL